VSDVEHCTVGGVWRAKVPVEFCAVSHLFASHLMSRCPIMHAKEAGKSDRSMRFSIIPRIPTSPPEPGCEVTVHSTLSLNTKSSPLTPHISLNTFTHLGIGIGIGISSHTAWLHKQRTENKHDRNYNRLLKLTASLFVTKCELFSVPVVAGGLFPLPMLQSKIVSISSSHLLTRST
jgi:hypothetical protein